MTQPSGERAPTPEELNYQYMLERVAFDEEQGIKTPEQFFAALGRAAYELSKETPDAHS